ncbi:cation:proton antiporter domain-containing protein [Streptomyces sp. MJM1172]|uniref:cation:proton antiporter domain-containing protein n=1 Tax=Streptomyces sp. MJM1172 TaxID=1703926 RepID=UPI00093E78FD|nr:cation:proton antiporter [Streptomyces sp. MJM1172]OKI61766.1 sodium:proton exchanger [Streptomyces sp. MJM1172]
MTSSQVLAGTALIVALAVGSQLVASLMRIPAILLLLPAGFITGVLTDDVNPEKLLGAAFSPLVSLAVAVILFDAGLGLDTRRLQGHTRTVVVRLIWLGALLTAAATALLAVPVLGMSCGAAVMLGAILVVSGPTVVGPLLDFVRPSERLQRVLVWEGTLIDPLGGILGALVFHGVRAGGQQGLGSQVLEFGGSAAVGLLGGIAGAAALWLLLRRLDLGEVLGTTVQFAAVVAVAAACDAFRDDTGLIAAVVMGMALANLPGLDIPARRPFFETLVSLIIGVLFVSISATVTPRSLSHVVLPALVLVAALVLVIRPLVALLSTARTDVPYRERWFIGWMAPRGIVAVKGPVHRLEPPTRSHGVIAPYTGGGALFSRGLGRTELARRYAGGARVVAFRVEGDIPPGHEVLFLVRPSGQLLAVTDTTVPVPAAGDTAILLTPAAAPGRG